VAGVDLHGGNVGGCVIEAVDTLHGREFDIWRASGPIAGGGDDEEGAGRHHGGKFDVAPSEAQVGGVFAHAAALEVGGDPVDGRGYPYSLVDGGEHEGLCTTAGSAGAGDALRVDIGQGREEIDCADAVPELHPHEADAPEEPLSIEESSLAVAGLAIHVACHLGGLKRAVVVADHVIGKGDISLAGEADAAGRNRATIIMREAAMAKMAVGADNAGKRSLAVPGPIEIAGNEESRRALKVNVFDRVVFTFDSACNVGVEPSLFGHRPKPCADKDLTAQLLRPGFPRGAGGVNGKIADHVLMSDAGTVVPGNVCPIWDGLRSQSLPLGQQSPIRNREPFNLNWAAVNLDRGRVFDRAADCASAVETDQREACAPGERKDAAGECDVSTQHAAAPGAEDETLLIFVFVELPEHGTVHILNRS